MAIDQTIDEEPEAAASAARKPGIGRTVLLVLTALLLVGISVGATLFMAGMLGGGAAISDSAPAADNAGAQAKRSPIYMEFGEPFVVNFVEGNQIRYLQVRIEGMTRDPSIPAHVSKHLPRIRNNLVFMFSGFDYASLGTVAGKQRIRDEALAEVQNVLRQEIGDAGVEAIYFTSFVMQ
ncbi:MAG: flagellar basal body-associated FliL family protein [Gammaproteobacteria bacterium]|jgi:flagellar FliL protein|nr:flagellar basal body-associated FliL family protein [Gammaproteobacteria bacterium]